MPKVVSPAELDAILGAIDQHPQGAGIEDLLHVLTTVPRRTLQRRLADLVEAGRLQIEGQGRAVRYKRPGPLPLVVAPESVPDGQVAQPAAEGYVPLSAGGAQVRELVRRPLAERTPIGYQRDFLDRYIPNETAYLAPPLRQRLHDWGRSPAGNRPAGTYVRDIFNRLLVDLSWASSRLEGNTYTRLDTENLIEFGAVAEGKDQLEAQMILNHKAAIEMLVENAEDVGFNVYTFCNLHALLSENLLPDPGASGRVRRILVGITGTVYQPTAIPQVIDEYFRHILAKADAITDPYEQAFFIMVHIPYLQPFEDVNKRVSRLGANISLIRNNLAPLSFVDVPEKAYTEAMLGVYELNRIELLLDVFMWAYERSCQRYTLLKEALPAPDPLRLRYRGQLRDVVGQIVRDTRAIEPQAIREVVGTRIPPADMPEFVALVINELHHLHEGNIVRYGLRLSEFRDWKSHIDSRG